MAFTQPDNPDPDLTSENDTEALEALESVENTYDQKLREYIESVRAEDQVYKTYVYKFDSSTGQEKSLCGQWENDVPDGHTVGMTYGSGRYLIISTAPPSEKNKKRLVRSFRFKIHAHYDDLRRTAVQNVGNYAPPSIGQGAPRGMPGAGCGVPQAINPAEVMQSGLSMVSDVIKLLAPLLVARQNTGMPDMSGLMVKQYETMADVMRHSIIEQGKAYSEMTRKVREVENISTDDEEDGESEKSMLEQIIPLLEQFIPLILGKGPQAAITAGTVRALPQFKKLMSDKSELTRIIEYVDKSQGKEKTDLLLKKLKINRP